MNSFFVCPVDKCNRKYKTKHKLELHLSGYHDIIEPIDIGSPIQLMKKTTLQHDKKNIELNDTCSICLCKPSDTATIPCGHKRFCYECISNYMNTSSKNCPICRSIVISVYKIY